jgi:alpha-D-xyloside xylohydrolase
MEMKRFSLALLFFIVASSCYAQSYQKTAQGIKTTVNATDIEIQFYTPSMVRVIKSPQGRPFNNKSLSVIMEPGKTAFTVQQDKSNLKLKSDKLTVDLNLKSGDIAYLKAGDTVLKEKTNGVKFTPFNDAGDNTYTASQSFALDKEEAIYGLGQHQRGNLNQRNQSYRLIQDNLEDVVPFFQSIKGYGIFWDNYSPTTFTDNTNETSFSSDVADGIDYYFMYGGNADGVIACMRELTGQVPMLPLWTYGYWQSKERYKSQDELTDVVKKYRALHVPLDGIIQDWQYWGCNYLWNAMDFLNPEFYNPKKMVQDIHGMNAHMIISIWSAFGPETKPFRELKEKGMLIDFTTWPESGVDKWPIIPGYPSGVKVYDAYNPQARDIYWKYVNQGLFADSIDGWWMDSSEPDHLNKKQQDYDQKTFLGSFRKVRNAYPLMSVGGVYEHQRQTTSSKRVFILTRSAFAGQQRYGANTWSGDIAASWETFKKQIPTGLNFSLSGIPYWNCDIGGFFLWNYKKKLEDPEYRELYARWLAFGSLCPMMRSHGTDAPREIYQFGKPGTPVYDAIEKFIHLRYRLLPYIYSVSHDVTANQSSMMRALMMDFPDDKNVWNMNNEFMFGKSLLAKPVTDPQYLKKVSTGKDTSWAEDFSTVKTTSVYLPGTTGWYDFWTGAKYTGGEKVTRETPLNIIPLYVKAGSMLPIGPDVQYAEEKKWDDLEIRIYPGANGHFVLYEDENDNYNYEKGAFSTIAFDWNDAKKILTINDRKGSFPGMLTTRKFNLVLVKGTNAAGIDKSAGADKVIVFDGRKTAVKF